MIIDDFKYRLLEGIFKVDVLLDNRRQNHLAPWESIKIVSHMCWASFLLNSLDFIETRLLSEAIFFEEICEKKKDVN